MLTVFRLPLIATKPTFCTRKHYRGRFFVFETLQTERSPERRRCDSPPVLSVLALDGILRSGWAVGGDSEAPALTFVSYLNPPQGPNWGADLLAVVLSPSLSRAQAVNTTATTRSEDFAQVATNHFGLFGDFPFPLHTFLVKQPTSSEIYHFPPAFVTILLSLGSQRLEIRHVAGDHIRSRNAQTKAFMAF